MSLILSEGTHPQGLEAKTYGPLIMERAVHLGGYEISMEDFCFLAEYVLTNTDLQVKDPRTELVRRINLMQEVSGYNPNGKRLGIVAAGEESW